MRWNGKGFLPGIPARDLTNEEVERFGGEEALEETGLYERTEPKRRPQRLRGDADGVHSAGEIDQPCE